MTKMNRKHSFASKLSWKVVLITSAIFFVALTSVAIYGGRIMEAKSNDFIRQTIHTSILDIQGKLQQAEQTAISMGRTVEKFQHNGMMLDTASCFDLMAETVTSYISELRMTMASKQRLENELDVARKIQMQMLSTDFPSFKNIGLLVYSDGITEAENNAKELYGNSRLLEWAESHGTAKISNDKAVVELLLASVGNFTAGAEQNDDMTIMSISV